MDFVFSYGCCLALLWSRIKHISKRIGGIVVFICTDIPGGQGTNYKLLGDPLTFIYGHQEVQICGFALDGLP